MSDDERDTRSGPRSPRWFAAGALGLGLLVGVALYSGVATSGGATCPSRWLFDAPCAGCGMTRAFEGLLHGDLGYALRANVVSPVLFTLAAIVALVFGAQLATGRDLYRALAARRLVRGGVSALLLALVLIAWVSNQMRHKRGEGPLHLRTWHHEHGRAPLVDLPGGERQGQSRPVAH
ncbi:MAG: DUF2752 domain-containing protein [Myxococcales bacterium]|nr:DUF2752 domain-containing protein [Myxococcales bacterium]